jgi:hypothetical protein
VCIVWRKAINSAKSLRLTRPLGRVGTGRRWMVWASAPALALFLFVPICAQSQEQVLYSFQGGTDGANPLGRIVRDSAGNLYGATSGGGSSDCWGSVCGTVYQLAPPSQPNAAWSETVLHVFLGHTYGDGSSLQGGLVMDSAGNLYGSTGYGGTGNCEVVGTYPGCGTVYELSPPAQKGGAWTEAILYNFQGGNDGFVPLGDLVFDNTGNLYGATIFGGGHGTNCGDAFYQYCGTIYELSPPQKQGGAWAEQVLYSFKGIPWGAATRGDGAWPNGGLAIDSTGAVYGTTQLGGSPAGAHPGWGTVFKLTPSGKPGQQWTETMLHRFLGGTDGWTPAAGLISDANGNLYGVTEVGGTGGWGTIFEMTKQVNGQWQHSVLSSFDGGYDGGQPESNLSLDAQGNLYGEAEDLGDRGFGTLYELPSHSGPYSPALNVLYDFGSIPNGAIPYSSVLFDPAGNIYGTTNHGGADANCGFPGCGIVFEVTR